MNLLIRPAPLDPTHPVLVVHSVMPEVDKVDDVGVLELCESLKNLDKHLFPAALSVRIADLVPDHLHSIVCVHRQVSCINAWDIAINLRT